tara:strand:+ start:58 stop:738 length:681 start_codon:yes stop_codon:yes gene_type:complete
MDNINDLSLNSLNMMLPSLFNNIVIDSNTLTGNNFIDRNFQILSQRQELGNYLLNNQENPNILSESLNQENKYRQVISEEGKKSLKKEEYEKDICSNESCPITQEEFKKGDEIIILPCKHGFIEEYINQWLETQCPECPICRYKLDSTEIKNQDYDEETPTHISRNEFLNSLSTISSIMQPFSPLNINQILNMNRPTSINPLRSEETDLNEAILNSLKDISNNSLD